MSSSSWRAPAAVLLLLQVVCCCFVSTAMAQQVPSCPINIPATNLTSPAVISIPPSGDAVFRLAPGTNYTISATGNTVQAGQTVCIEGLGGDNQAVVIQAVVSTPHLNLKETSVLHLSGLTLQGDPAIVAGGIAFIAPGIATNLTTITSSNLRLTQMGGPAVKITGPVKFTSHNFELVDNFNKDTSSGSDPVYSAFLMKPLSQQLSSELTFGGQTLVQGNQGAANGAGILFYNDAGATASLTVTFNGVTKFIANQGINAGGAFAVIPAGGARTDVRFKGPVLEVRGNQVAADVGAGATSATGGGMAFANYAVTATSVEFGAESMIFASNIVDSGSSVTADAGGAALAVVAAGGNLTVSFIKPATFVGNRASPNKGNGDYSSSGGAVSLGTFTGSALTLNILSCLSFKDNVLQPYSSANASVGAALSVGDFSSDNPTVVAVTGPSGQLLFSNNTVSGIGQQDVSITALSNSTITCPTVPAKGPGLYQVSNDICAASGANVTSGGKIVGPPASCTAGPNACTGLPPANITNSNGWQCPFPDVSPEGTTCSAACLAGFFGRPAAICTASVWQTTGSCAGCTPPIPTGGTTLISGYSSCSTSLISGSYTIGTVCIPICVSGSSGGRVSCGQTSPAAFPSWQVTPCRPDCSGSPPATVPGITSWPCGGRTPVGETCTAACDTGAGWSGGPIAATCTGSGWSNTTTGSCKRVVCIGPPSPQPPNATFTCTASTPVGQSCVATCSPGLTGSPSRVCLDTGEFGPLQGECVDCVGNRPRITSAANTTYVLQNSTSVSTLFTISGGYTNATINTQATMDGTIPCTTQPADLIGAQAETPINVTCQTAGGMTPGPHAIVLAVSYSSGSTGCGTGVTRQRTTIYAGVPPPPPPTVILSAAGATPPCKAANGSVTFFSATFDFEVTPTPVNVYAQVVAISPYIDLYCKTSRLGSRINKGQILVDCRGVFDVTLLSINITLKLAADVPGAPQGSAYSSQVLGFVCCFDDGAVTFAQVVDKVLVSSNPGAYCRTCGTVPASAAGVWQVPRPSPPPMRLRSGVLRTGNVSMLQCTSAGPDVGEVTATCDPSRPRLMAVKMVVPSGSLLDLLHFQTRCNAPPASSAAASCTDGTYSWRNVNTRENSLEVVAAGGQVTYTFGILIAPAAGCDCQKVFFAVRTVGILGLGRAPDGNGSCADAQAVTALGAAPPRLSMQTHSSVVAAPADLIAAANAERRRVRNSQIPVAPLPAATPRRP